MKVSRYVMFFVLVFAAQAKATQGQLREAFLRKATRVVNIAKNTDGDYKWLSDTRVIVTLPGSKQAVIYDITSKKTVPLTEAQKTLSDRQLEQEMKLNAQFQFWGTHRSTNPPVPLLSQPPGNAFIEEAVMSPNHASILWVLIIPSRKPDARRQSHSARSSGVQKRQHVVRTRTFWLSNADGTRLHRLVDVGLRDPHEADLLWVAWLPKSHRISFEYHGILYTLPVQ